MARREVKPLSWLAMRTVVERTGLVSSQQLFYVLPDGPVGPRDLSRWDQWCYLRRKQEKLDETKDLLKGGAGVRVSDGQLLRIQTQIALEEAVKQLEPAAKGKDLFCNILFAHSARWTPELRGMGTDGGLQWCVFDEWPTLLKCGPEGTGGGELRFPEDAAEDLAEALEPFEVRGRPECVVMRVTLQVPENEHVIAPVWHVKLLRN